MKLSYPKLVGIGLLFLSLQAKADSSPRICQINGESKKIHVWYTLNNMDASYSWFIQISRIYENNIAFVDENCNVIDLNEKISILPNSTQKFGMLVLEDKSFNSIYSFTGVRNDGELNKVPNRKVTCLFVVAPYGPGQMHRTDWKLNNSDCYSTEFGTKLNFK